MQHTFPGLGREFMPALDEGSFLYMPSLVPAGSLTEVVESMAQQNMAMETVPEVASVVGKAGRVESALDPAPIGMIETIVLLKPQAQWRKRPVDRFYKNWPAWLTPPLRDMLARRAATLPKMRFWKTCARRPTSPACCPVGCSRSKPASSCSKADFGR